MSCKNSKITITFFFIVIITILVCFLITKLPEPNKQSKTGEKIVINDESLTDTLKTITYWDVFYDALIFIESSNNIEAVNSSTGALGLIQSLPEGYSGYIDEANRILGYKKFTNELLLSDIDANRECFEIVNKRHNPNKSVELAIKLHNPKADQSYTNAIYNKMNEIIESYRND